RGHLQMAAEARRRPGGMTGVARDAAVRVSELGIVRRHALQSDSVLVHQLGAIGLLAEMRIAGRDCVNGLDNFPFEIRIVHGPLKKLAVAPLEAAESPRGAKRFEVPAAGRSGGAGSE